MKEINPDFKFISIIIIMNFNNIACLNPEEEERKLVYCEVEVISWRERRIKAQISIHAHIQSVWNALTDYERLADYIPNLVSRFLLY